MKCRDTRFDVNFIKRIMTEFQIYYELFGKKMQCTIFADDIKDVPFLLYSKIIIHKIEEKTAESFNPANGDKGLDRLKDILGIK